MVKKEVYECEFCGNSFLLEKMITDEDANWLCETCIKEEE